LGTYPDEEPVDTEEETEQDEVAGHGIEVASLDVEQA